MPYSGVQLNRTAEPSLEYLPIDILLHIFRELDVTDILVVRQTCKALRDITYERSVWYDVLCVHVLQKGMPVPGLRGRPIASLATDALEHITLRALRFRRNWTSPRPVCMHHVDIQPVHAVLPGQSPHPRIGAVHFLPQRDRQLLLTLTICSPLGAPRWYMLQCWDIALPEPVCVAAFRSVAFFGLNVNSDCESPGVIALTQRSSPGIDSKDAVSKIVTSILSVEPSASDPTKAFGILATFPSFPYPLRLHGTTLVTTDADNIVRMLDTTTGQTRHELHPPMRAHDPTVHLEEHKCLEALLLDGFALTFCRQWIYLYVLPATSSASVHASLLPVAQYKWQWRIDSIVVAQSRRTARPTIDIFLRFDSWFPWPVNILHHFVLRANPAYVLSADPASLVLPYLATLPVDAPVMLSMIPSPVRLFTPSDMCVGRNGTALWLDAHNDVGMSAHAGDHGQRIAGKILAIVGDKNGPDADAGSVMMLFCARECNDGWNKLALDEEEGNIAVGSVDGRVTLFSYVRDWS